MLTIVEDVSKWQTVTQLIDYLNQHDVTPFPVIVDIGAKDGKTDSNSWNFIIDNGWMGLLIEPIPSLAIQVKEVYGFKSVSVELDTTNMSAESEDQIPLKDVLAKHDIKKVGALSLNSRGNDLAVITAWFKQTKVRPDVIISEVSKKNNEEKTAELLKNGYGKILHIGDNEVFLKGK